MAPAVRAAGSAPNAAQGTARSGFCAYQEAVGHGASLQVEFPLLCTRDEAHRMPYPDMTLKPGMVICVEAYAGEVGGGDPA
jgi:hypothetical protein